MRIAKQLLLSAFAVVGGLSILVALFVGVPFVGMGAVDAVYFFLVVGMFHVPLIEIFNIFWVVAMAVFGYGMTFYPIRHLEKWYAQASIVVIALIGIVYFSISLMFRSWEFDKVFALVDLIGCIVLLFKGPKCVAKEYVENGEIQAAFD